MKSLTDKECSKQRKRFETWYRKHHPCRHFEVNAAGRYTDFETAHAWNLWRAARTDGEINPLVWHKFGTQVPEEGTDIVWRYPDKGGIGLGRYYKEDRQEWDPECIWISYDALFALGTK